MTLTQISRSRQYSTLNRNSCVGACVCGAGYATEGNSDAVGEPDHGYASVAGVGHRTADRRTTKSQAVRPQYGAHLSNDAQKHHRAFHLPAHRRTGAALCR